MVLADESTADVSVEEEAPAAEPEVAQSPLTRADRVFLQRVLRFTTGIQSPQYATRAVTHGYDGDAHKEGLRLLSVAIGIEKPLEHCFQENALLGEGNGSSSELLVELDEMENLWLPRARAIIRHKVPRQHRDAFAAAFFKDLEQQPLGAGVVGSMSVFVGRVEDLAKSDQPGARAVFETLAARGLTRARITHIKGLLAIAQRAPAIGQPRPSVEVIAKAQQQQREAVADLRDWFNDWATTLRPLFGVRDQVTLGLTQLNRPKGGEDEEPDVPPAPAPPV